MAMTLIEGKFKVIKAAPDGDSIRFYPNNPNLWEKLPTRVSTNRAGGVQLRLDSVDTLETHYNPKGDSISTQHQPLEFAHGAASELLKFLGFKKITRNDNEVVTASQPEEVPGFILTRFADVYGRSVAFAFKGNADVEDGSDVYFDKPLLKKSANYHMLAKGLAYPTFYSKLYPDIRQELATVADKARKENKGLWPLDKTNEGFILEELETITDNVVILPKLYRRLLSYLAINDGSVSLDGFLAYLKSTKDRLIILPEGHVTGFDYVVKVDGQNILLTTQPEDLVFLEK
ncbi:thermonuclease family protein [Nostoc sp. FACHB-152]|uniref:thermonuclease family protein n=1 Tax=unclassified Nostoc TaxID=2593658 RepID=UPI001681C7AA|nr:MULTISPECIES: thermonuclease family protein [unclassified Nostoc]MBD2448539.1 thermonuclease family protein [Nostoc sp. FACHB-152]MBD2466276.1 thermonuclease family protein [Nostoc sp. FACHB-145]